MFEVVLVVVVVVVMVVVVLVTCTRQIVKQKATLVFPFVNHSINRLGRVQTNKEISCQNQRLLGLLFIWLTVLRTQSSRWDCCELCGEYIL